MATALHYLSRVGGSMKRTSEIGVLIFVILVLTGCTRAAAGTQPPPPPEVEVTEAQQKDVPIQREWVGTLDGTVNAAIKAQVTGYLLTQNYSEGAFVNKGQLLFEIDPRPFQAALDQTQGQFSQANGQLAQAKAQLSQAQAQLLQAQANQRRTQLDVERYTPLAKQQAVSQQDLDNATQNNIAAEAQVEAAKAQIEAAKAAVEAARVNLGFTHITSPIAGIAGKAQVQIGNLVSPAAGPITTVSTLDPIKVEFTVPEQEYLNLMRSGSALDRLQLALILADGTTYGQKGKFLFADRQVDPGTGAIELTGLFPNPGNTLRPGQYGKIRATTGVRTGAVLIPQAAVTELQGSYQVAVVGQDNRVAIRPVKAGERAGSMWVIENGLKAGESVVVEGQQNLRPGTQVQPKPFKGTNE